MKCEGGFGIDGHVGGAQGLIVGDGLIGSAQHQVEFGILEFEAHEFERAHHLIFGDAHGQVLPALAAATASGTVCGRRSSSAALLRIGLARRGENGDELEPGSPIHNFLL